MGWGLRILEISWGGCRPLTEIRKGSVGALECGRKKTDCGNKQTIKNRILYRLPIGDPSRHSWQESHDLIFRGGQKRKGTSPRSMYRKLTTRLCPTAPSYKGGRERGAGGSHLAVRAERESWSEGLGSKSRQRLGDGGG